MSEPKPIDSEKRSKQEGIKQQSAYLRGNILEDLAGPQPFVTEETYELLKFHGSYEQYDRDTATERKKQGLEKEYSFMLRLRIPGGRMTAEQYLLMDELVDRFANGTLRLTTRQTLQFHCILKPHLKPAIADINKALLSTIAACGDVVRNVTTCPAPVKNAIHDRLEADARLLSEHFSPKSGSYVQVWMDEVGADTASKAPEEVEPIYGDRYLPRKFKIGVAQPEDNCIDLLTHDLGLWALAEDGVVKGYNVCLGGGLGMSHNNAKTYPRLASSIAYVPEHEMLAVSEAVIKLQRDYGDRSDRKHARLKYVVEERGVEWTRKTLEEYFGKPMLDPLPIPKVEVENHLGWNAQGDGKWFLGVPVPSGRITDYADAAIRSAIREVVKTYAMNVVITADQNILFCDVETGEKPAIEAIFRRHGVKLKEDLSLVAQHIIACVALPTCGKALAEAERIQQPLTQLIEQELANAGLGDERMAIRIAGCPNACSRPYVGDISIVGRAPGLYALFTGGDFEGTRLAEKLFDKVTEEDLPAALAPMFVLYREGRRAGEGFGDFCHRAGLAALQDAVRASLGERVR